MDPNINKQTNINHEFELITDTSLNNNDFLLSDNIINNQNSFQLTLQQNDLPKMSSFSLTTPLKSFAHCIYYNYFPSINQTKSIYINNIQINITFIFIQHEILRK